MPAIPIFISYGHFDDEPSPGWVSAFAKQLDIRLKQYIGEDAFVLWADTQLPGHVNNWGRIEEKLAHAEVLVPIVSKRYVHSPACWHEMSQYYQRWHEGLWVDQDSARVFKVVKLPITRDEIPPDVNDELKSIFVDKLNGYQFYKIINEKGAFRELDAEIDRKEYLDQLSDLTFELANFIKRLIHGAAAPKRLVYLAETTPDLAESRDAIRRDLSERGFTVLPMRPINWNSSDYPARVRDDLDRCELSVHIFGTRRGIVPDETTQLGIGSVQLDLALASSHSCPRIVWVPDDVKPDAIPGNEHREYLQKLVNGGFAKQGVDVLRGHRDELKTVILDALNPPAPKPAAPSVDERPKVFIIFHESDADAASEIATYLTTQGFDTFVPMFDGDDAARLQYHRELLTICNGVLLYQGKAPDAWFKPNDLDLLKSAGYAPARTIARAEYLGPPETVSKKVLSRGNLRVVKTFAGLDPTALAPFVQDVLKAYAGHADAARAR
jgi:hypothetical protein